MQGDISMTNKQGFLALRERRRVYDASLMRTA